MAYKRNNAKTVFKTSACTLLTIALTLGCVKIFGKQIANSAYAYNFGEGSLNLLQLQYGISNREPEKTKTVQETGTAETEDTASTGTDASQNVTETAQTVPAVTDNPDAIAVNLSAVSGKYTQYGGTSVINGTDYDVTKLLYADYTHPKINKDEPYILIYHTHTSEDYYGGGTVVDVGDAMAKEFEALGYKTIHLTEFYDREQFSGAYSRSIKGVEDMLKKYPSIQLCFDIHRDSIVTKSGDTYRPVTQVEGKNTAQVMLVCGTDSKGLSHPQWRENFKFALDISRTMGEKYGALSRPVNLRADRFNTHVTKYAVLMEVGSNANTLEEAKNAAVYTARSVVATIE